MNFYTAYRNSQELFVAYKNSNFTKEDIPTIFLHQVIDVLEEITQCLQYCTCTFLEKNRMLYKNVEIAGFAYTPAGRCMLKHVKI